MALEREWNLCLQKRREDLLLTRDLYKKKKNELFSAYIPSQKNSPLHKIDMITATNFPRPLHDIFLLLLLWAKIYQKKTTKDNLITKTKLFEKSCGYLL